MARFFGRRPNPTPSISRALRRRFLHPGEQVLAGVYVQRPRTNRASLGGAASAGIGATTGVYAASLGKSEGEARWLEWALEMQRVTGVDAAVAKRTSFVTLALTDTRVLLVRRSRLWRLLHREELISWPLPEIDHIKVGHAKLTLTLAHDRGVLQFELPLSIKFLDRVYVDLPKLFSRALEDARSTHAGEPKPTSSEEN